MVRHLLLLSLLHRGGQFHWLTFVALSCAGCDPQADGTYVARLAHWGSTCGRPVFGQDFPWSWCPWRHSALHHVRQWAHQAGSYQSSWPAWYVMVLNATPSVLEAHFCIICFCWSHFAFQGTPGEKHHRPPKINSLQFLCWFRGAWPCLSKINIWKWCKDGHDCGHFVAGIPCMWCEQGYQHVYQGTVLWTAHIMHLMIFWEAHSKATERAEFYRPFWGCTAPT